MMMGSASKNLGTQKKREPPLSMS